MCSSSSLLLSSVPGPDAVLGPGGRRLACRHARRCVHRQAVPLPELQGPTPQRSAGVGDQLAGSWRVQVVDLCGVCVSSPWVLDVPLCGLERQRPGSLSSALGAHGHTPSFPALPRPSGGSRGISFFRETLLEKLRLVKNTHAVSLLPSLWQR